MNEFMKRKTLLVAFWANYNLGDDLFVSILLKRYPNVSFNLIANKGYKVFSDYSNVRNVGTPVSFYDRVFFRFIKLFSTKWYVLRYLSRYRSFFKEKIKNTDAYILIGGSMFKESKSSSVSSKIDDLVSRTIKKRKFIVGVNFGPFSSSSFYQSYHNIFSRYDDVCFRDNYSYNLFKDLGCVRVAEDIVFSYQIPDVCNEKKKVGFVINDFDGHEGLSLLKKAYEEMILFLVQDYISQGYSVTLFAFQKSEKKYLKSFANFVQRRCLGRRISMFCYEGDIDAFLIEYYRHSLIYATRFHSMILSFMQGQKVCPIIYNKKMLNFIEDVGYNGFYISLDDMNIEIDSIRTFNEAAAVKYQFKRNAERHFQSLDSYLLS
jgi:colanic acid/amylovoran biosynthesis protein